MGNLPGKKTEKETHGSATAHVNFQTLHSFIDAPLSPHTHALLHLYIHIHAHAYTYYIYVVTCIRIHTNCQLIRFLQSSITKTILNTVQNDVPVHRTQRLPASVSLAGDWNSSEMEDFIRTRGDCSSLSSLCIFQHQVLLLQQLQLVSA